MYHAAINDLRCVFLMLSVTETLTMGLFTDFNNVVMKMETLVLGSIGTWLKTVV